jgi:uncharacterized protein (TIGR00251 family)
VIYYFLESMTSFKAAIKNSNQGVLLCLHVVIGSSQVAFPAGYNQWRKCIEIKVRSAAKDNRANNEVIETVAGFFRVPRKNVILVSGQKSKEKTVCISKISKDMACSQLEESLHGL